MMAESRSRLMVFGRRVVLLLSFALLPLLPSACRAAASLPPNVIMIVMDTVRGDHCSIDGYDRNTTPNLARIGSEGVIFRDAWSPAGWTGPAHSSIFTGLRPEHTGYLIDNRLELDDSFVTLAERLRKAGYRTVCLTNNTMVGPKFGLTQGFETYESVLDQKDPGYPTCRWAHRAALTVARQAKTDGVPLYLYVNDMEAHLEYTPFEPFQDEFVPPKFTPEEIAEGRSFGEQQGNDIMLGKRRISRRETELLTDLYDAEIAGLDSEIGKFFDEMKKEGLLDHTLLMIFADHGENLGDHGLFRHRADIHRSICHVPLVIRYPGHFDGGRINDHVVRLTDLYPTVLDLAGLPIPKGLDGVSLTHDLDGRVARCAYGRAGGNLKVPHLAPPANTSLFSLSFRAAYDGRWHLIRDSKGREELYDVRADPGERVNLAGAQKAVLARMEKLLPKD